MNRSIGAVTARRLSAAALATVALVAACRSTSSTPPARTVSADTWATVDGVDITIGRGETVGVVGESGCGKTVTAMSVLRLIAIPPGRIVDGQILWQGRDLIPLENDQLDDIRAKDIAMVFQETMTSLNPVYTVGEQIAEGLRRHERLSRRAAL